MNVMWGDLMRSPLQVKHINDSIFIDESLIKDIILCTDQKENLQLLKQIALS
jgi:hypothetical protein